MQLNNGQSGAAYLFQARGETRPSRSRLFARRHESQSLPGRARVDIMTIDTALQSIITVRSLIPDDAFTAATLGTLREGSGVVIREDGLVLTIGYLITEAEEVWLTRHDGQVIPGHALAYDHETGFGLAQAIGPLGVPAVDFGDAARAQVGDPVVLADGIGQFVRANIVAKQEFAGYWEYVLDEAIFIAPGSSFLRRGCTARRRRQTPGHRLASLANEQKWRACGHQYDRTDQFVAADPG